MLGTLTIRKNLKLLADATYKVTMQCLATISSFKSFQFWMLGRHVRSPT